MKHIQSYEKNVNTTNSPKLGDFVYCLFNEKYTQDFDKFLKDKIGIITEIKYKNNDFLSNNYYIVTYQGKMRDWSSFADSQFTLELHNILYWSESKKDVEQYIEALKYNL